MAAKVNAFKGIQLITSAYSETLDKDILYFVRTNDPKSGSTEGYIQFNGKKYGNVAKLRTEIHDLLGDLPEDKGYTFAQWIAEVEAKATAAKTVVSEDATHLTISATTDPTTSAVTYTLGESGITGEGIKMEGYSKPTSSTAITSNDTINEAIGKLEKGLEIAVAGGLQEIVSESGITVSEVEDNKQTISAKVVAENGLSVDADGIKMASATTSVFGTVKLSNESGTSEAVAATPKAINDAIKALDVDAIAVAADSTILSISENDGKIAATSQKIAIVHTQVTDWDANIGVTGVTAGNGITVTNGNSQNPTVAAKVASGDKVLSTDENGLHATIGLSYVSGDTGDKKIHLTGIDGEDIATIDASDFIKDGMLDSATYETSTHIITLVWNTDAGKSNTEIDVSDLVDTYLAGNGLQLNDNEFSVKLDTSTEGFLTVGEGGLKLSGVQDAIDTAIAGLDATESGETSDGFVSVEVGEEDGKLTAVTVTDKVVALSAATTDNKGLAEASDAKKYVDDAVAGKNVTATGDTYVSATAANNKVTVSATQSTKDSLAKADDALQSISNGSDGDYVTTTISDKANNNQTVGVAVTVQAVSAATGSNKGLAEASDVKSYVDSEAHVQTAVTYIDVAGEEKTAASEGANVQGVAQGLANAISDVADDVKGLDTDDITATGITSAPSTATTATAVFNDIYSKLAAQSGATITGVTSSDQSITVSAGTNTVNIVVNRETAADTTVADGHIELKQNDNGALYGVMYYGGDDAE